MFCFLLFKDESSDLVAEFNTDQISHSLKKSVFPNERSLPSSVQEENCALQKTLVEE